MDCFNLVTTGGILSPGGFFTLRTGQEKRIAAVAPAGAPRHQGARQRHRLSMSFPAGRTARTDAMRHAAPGIADGAAPADMPLPKRTPSCSAEKNRTKKGRIAPDRNVIGGSAPR